MDASCFVAGGGRLQRRQWRRRRTPPSADQHVTCEISAPADGAEVDMSAKMTIEGDAEIDAGKISKVTLTVGGKVVSDVTSVPFTYGGFYQFHFLFLA